MKRTSLGITDLNASAICYGSAGFGSSRSGRDLARLINHYRDAGGNFLDTAHAYSFWLPQGTGCSERAIGQYIRENGRGDLIIATKGGHPPASGYERTENYLSAARIGADIDDSLANLQLYTLDLFWLHRDDTRRPVGEILETLNAEVRRGRIRWFGASNWHHTRMQESRDHAAEHGLQSFCANQPEWNLAQRSDEPPDGPGTGQEMRTLSPSDRRWHRETGTPIVSYSSAAAGYFASHGRRVEKVYDTPTSRDRLERVLDLACRQDVTPGQIALAWLLNQDIEVVPIIGTLDTAHLSECLAAANVLLSPEEVGWLEHGEKRGQS